MNFIVHGICYLVVAIDINVVSFLVCIGLVFSPLYSCCICSGEICFKGTMKCFNFSNKEKNNEQRAIQSNSVRSTSTSISTDLDLKPFGSEFNSQNVSEFSTASSAKSFAILSQRQSNLREFTFSELKAATKNFSRTLMIGEGGFGGVFKAVIRSTDDPHKKIDVAIKQLSRRGLQACFFLLLNLSENILLLYLILQQY